MQNRVNNTNSYLRDFALASEFGLKDQIVFLNFKVDLVSHNSTLPSRARINVTSSA